MKINILTLFPEMFEPIIGGSILGLSISGISARTSIKKQMTILLAAVQEW